MESGESCAGAMNDCLIIGICGGTGSGKTTLAERLKTSLGEDALLLSMDSYYRDRPDLTYEERCRLNYDHPDSLDIGLLSEHLKRLKAGEPIDYPTYDFTTYLRKKEWLHADGCRVLILEGILLFCCPEIAEQLDIKVFVDTDADVRILRRVRRDVRERGRSLESVERQYLETVKPMHEKYVEPYKRIADVIVPQGGQNDVAFRMILSLLKKRLEASSR